MLASITLLLLGSLLVASAHGLADRNMDVGFDDGELAGTKIRPVNETFGNHRYYIPGKKVKWIDAVAHCASLGGWLTDVESREELGFLQKTYKKAGDAFSFWVGAAAMGPNKSFIWIKSKKQVKNFWRPGQPKPEEGNCVFFVWSEPTPILNVFDCNDKNRPGRGFICKFPAK